MDLVKFMRKVFPEELDVEPVHDCAGLRAEAATHSTDPETDRVIGL
jgi:hypothetical protein